METNTQSEQSMVQSSEAVRVGLLLALAGGFLDAYTYLERGQVFANAQTGNIVMLGIRLAQGQWMAAARYLLPIFAFVAGVVLTELIRARGKAHPAGRLHWRQRVLVLELAVLALVGLFPAAEGWNMAANVCVSFVCSLQVEAFRRVHGKAFATTMCTGNLRSGTELLIQSFRSGDAALRQHALNYYGVILAFVTGAAVSVFFCGSLGPRAVWIGCIALVAALLLLFRARLHTRGPV